ncbi:MAG: hypothetical protein K0S09_5 [Sphingobacteriaceae bacterium]|jgi:hypothetical protein|nr:hypothetical protein [Sphingobacteriaceae bacterium]
MMYVQKMEKDQAALIDLAKWVIAWVSGAAATILGINKIVDRWFEFKMKQQESLIKEIVKEVTAPEIDRLSKSIDELNKALWALQRKG